MARVINKHTAPLVFRGRFLLPVGHEVDLDDDVLKDGMSRAVEGSWVCDGLLVVLEQGQKLQAKHRGRGVFHIVDGDEVVMSGLTKTEADNFNNLSDGEKAEELELRLINERS